MQTNVPVNGRFLECGYTSFEVSGAIPRLMKDEHDKTMAVSHRCARYSIVENRQKPAWMIGSHDPFCYGKWIAAFADAPLHDPDGALFATLP